MRRSFQSSRSVRRISHTFLALALLSLARCTSVPSDLKACLGALSVITSGDAPTMFVGDRVDLTASFSGNDVSTCDPNDIQWDFDPTKLSISQSTGASVSVTALAAGSSRVTASAPGVTSGFVDLTVFRITGDLAVNVSGLPQGSNADIAVTGPNNFSDALTGSETLTDLAAGTYTFRVFDTKAANDHDYGYAPGTLTVQLGRNEAKQVDIPHIQRTGEATINPLGFGGFTGQVAMLTGSGISLPLDHDDRRLVLSPGNYRIDYWTLDPNGFQYVPNTPGESFTIGAGTTWSLSPRWVPQRAAIDLSYAGLPTGVSTGFEVVYSSTDRLNVNAGVTYVKPGTVSLTAPDVSVSTSLSQLDVYHFDQALNNLQLVAGTQTKYLIAYTLFKTLADYVFIIGINQDQFNHKLFINMWTSNTAKLTVELQQVLGGAARAARQIKIEAPFPFVTVTGTLADDGAIVATGSGTVAGRPNVPVRFTGQLLPDKSISASYQMGQSTAPTGLPNGPIVYGLTGSPRTP
jgi:hypothetical protein